MGLRDVVALAGALLAGPAGGRTIGPRGRAPPDVLVGAGAGAGRGRRRARARGAARHRAVAREPAGSRHPRARDAAGAGERGPGSSLRAVSVAEGEATLEIDGAREVVRPGSRVGGDTVKSVEPGRIVLERPAKPGEPGGPALVIVTFDEAGRAKTRVFSTDRSRHAPPRGGEAAVRASRLRALLACAPPRARRAAGARLAARRRRTSRRSSSRLERRDREQRAEFEAASARPLPAKARQRLEETRRAWAEGQGRLLGMLRALRAADAPAGAAASRGAAADVDEALALLRRIRAASRTEPLSEGELKTRIPDLRPPPLAASPATQVTAGDEPPIGTIAPEIRRKAASFSGPIEAYEWVRNAIRPELYHGVMKGPVQTLLESSGNDADTAGLLIALLRAKGIPARYVRGTVDLPAPLAVAVTGTASAERALRAFKRAGVPAEPLSGPGGIAAIRLERVWAEAYVPYANYRGAALDSFEKAWVPLDAGLKRLAPPGGTDVRSAGFAPAQAFDGLPRRRAGPHAARVLPPAGDGRPRRLPAGHLLRGGPRAAGRDRAEPRPAALHSPVRGLLARRGRLRAPGAARAHGALPSWRGTARPSSTRPSRCRPFSASGSPSRTSPSRRTTRRSCASTAGSS